MFLTSVSAFWHNFGSKSWTLSSKEVVRLSRAASWYNGEEKDANSCYLLVGMENTLLVVTCKVILSTRRGPDCRKLMEAQ